MAIAIALGAFGAHALKPVLTATASGVYETAVLYLLLHALALSALPFRASSARFLLLGMLFFSGSLLLLSTRAFHGLELRWLGPITPIGGLCLMAGWVLHAYHLFISKSAK